ncbi:hypothetical protein [Spirosoma arcticum]
MQTQSKILTEIVTINQLLTTEQVRQYNRDSYLIIQNFLNQAEVDKLYQVACRQRNAINDGTGDQLGK